MGGKVDGMASKFKRCAASWSFTLEFKMVSAEKHLSFFRIGAASKTGN
jgi:hypothetical protein